MKELLEIIFWLSAACVAYTYVGYPIALAAISRLRARLPRARDGYRAGVSFVLCAHDEQNRIAQRIDDIVALLAASEVPGEVIVVSDGSTDGTAEQARTRACENVRVIELTTWQGKACALNTGVAAAKNEILVFGDCRQRWDTAAIRTLLQNFADPDVGAVSGNLVLEAAPGVLAGIGMYWRFEKWLRKTESAIYSAVGVTGAICAVRRSLYPGVPAGTILDDVYWPMCVTLNGQRVIFETRAIAYDRFPERAGDEFLRKVRTLAGNYQLVARLPRTLLPWCNPVWLQFMSHKLMRLMVPWALLLMLASSAAVDEPIYRTLLIGQIAFYVLALAGNIRAVGENLRPAAAAASMVILNAAAWLAFWVWVSGRTGKSWRKVQYQGEV